MATPHNEASKGQIAKTVLMPGDPLRAKFISEKYLSDVCLLSSVRNMYCYKGTYMGKPVSVMGSGMGMPSMGIYSYELFTEYEVDNIIRIGSAGSYCEEAEILDVVLVTKAFSESTFAKTQNGYAGDTNYPSEPLTLALENSAKKNNIPIIKGCVHSSDVFYRADNSKEPYYIKLHEEKGCICVEMETFALFHNAAALNKNAACLVTISDSFVSKKELTAKERETAFDNMIKIALGF